MWLNHNRGTAIGARAWLDKQPVGRRLDAPPVVFDNSHGQPKPLAVDHRGRLVGNLGAGAERQGAAGLGIVFIDEPPLGLGCRGPGGQVGKHILYHRCHELGTLFLYCASHELGCRFALWLGRGRANV